MGFSCLHDAARAGDEYAIRTLHAEFQEANRAAANSTKSDGAGSLAVALTLEIIDQPDRLGFAPLHYAAMQGHAEVVETLLELGSKCDVRDAVQQTPLHLAVDGNHEAVVDLLLQYDCDVNAQDKNLFTALHRAAAAGHAGLVSLLIDHRADRALFSKTGWTALHVAAFYGSANITSLLLNGWDPNFPSDPNCWTPLHCAAMHGNVEVTRILLQVGACVNGRAIDGTTALTLAMKERHELVAAELVAFGATVDSASVPDDSVFRDLISKQAKVIHPGFDTSAIAVKDFPELPLQHNHTVSFKLVFPKGDLPVEGSLFGFFEQLDRYECTEGLPVAALCAALDCRDLQTGARIGSTYKFRLRIGDARKHGGVNISFTPSETGRYQFHLRTCKGQHPIAGFPKEVIVASDRTEALRNAERLRLITGSDDDDLPVSERLDMLEDSLICALCQKNRKDVALLPCAHVFLCVDCAAPRGKHDKRRVVQNCKLCGSLNTGFVELKFSAEET